MLERTPSQTSYGTGGTGWIAEHRQPLLDVPVAEDSRILIPEVLLERGVTAFNGVPVLLGDRLLGVLAVGSRREAPLSQPDVAVLQTLMGQAAVAIENARLYEASQREEAEAVALAEASRRFSATLRREAVLEELVQAAAHVLGEAWSLFVDRAGRRLAPGRGPDGTRRPGLPRRHGPAPGRRAAGGPRRGERPAAARPRPRRAARRSPLAPRPGRAGGSAPCWSFPS